MKTGMHFCVHFQISWHVTITAKEKKFQTELIEKTKTHILCQMQQNCYSMQTFPNLLV
jgi:hypothetical protein